MTLNYDGAGFLGSDWTEGAPSECSNLIPGQGPSTQQQISVQMYPNPAKEFMTLDVDTLPEEEGIFVMYDNYGKIVMKKKINKGESYNLDISEFGSGVYQTRVISGRRDMLSRLVLLD